MIQNQSSFLLWNKSGSFSSLKQLQINNQTHRVLLQKQSLQLDFEDDSAMKKLAQHPIISYRGESQIFRYHRKSSSIPTQRKPQLKIPLIRLNLINKMEDLSTNQQSSSPKKRVLCPSQTQYTHFFTSKFIEQPPLDISQVSLHPQQKLQQIKKSLKEYEFIKSQVLLGTFTTRTYDRFFKPNKMIGKNSHQHYYRSDIEKLKLNDPNIKLLVQNYALNSPDSHQNKKLAIQQLIGQIIENQLNQKYQILLNFLKSLIRRIIKQEIKTL